MNKPKAPKQFQEWLKQAEYDLEVAESLFKSRKYLYTVFMCHLVVEKALKAFYCRKIDPEPPRTHDLIFLSEKIALKLPKPMEEFLDKLNDLSVPTRYPDELESLLKQYNKSKTSEILNQTRETLKWLKAQS